VFYRLDLSSPLEPKATTILGVNLVYTHTLKPHPESIAQAEPQLVLYTDSVYPYTAYNTEEASTTAKLASEKIESYSPKKQSDVRGDTIEFGPYNDLEPLASSPLKIHYENEYPFVTMTTMRKQIEISHYGNINVEEHYILQHTGAKLRGVFSRYEYQRQQKSGASFRSIRALPPASASNIYYRDQIGNISTSAVRQEGSHTLMEVQPRFPMFGGWKTDFYIGYDVPASDFLYVDAADTSRYMLNISFACPFPEAVVDRQEILVILPEFSSDIKWVTPFEIDSESRNTHVTYLDTVGRPVLLLKKSNVVRLHDQPFQVVYRLSSVYLLQEPLLIVASFFGLFLMAMVYFRIELSLSDETTNKKGLLSLRVGPLGEVINHVTSQLPGLLQNVLRLGGADRLAVDEGFTKIRAYLTHLKQDPLLSNCAERLDAQVKAVRVAYKRAVDLKATFSHFTPTARAPPAAGAPRDAELDREQAAINLKARVEQAEKTLEELAEL